MPTRKSPTGSTKASESVVSRMIAKILKVQTSDDPEEVITQYIDSGSNAHVRTLLTNIHGIYPWVTNVANDVMSPNLTPLVEHLLSMPQTAFFVKDNAHSGSDSIWVAIGDPPADFLRSTASFRNRGFLHTWTLPDAGGYGQVYTLQLNSCQL